MSAWTITPLALAPAALLALAATFVAWSGRPPADLELTPVSALPRPITSVARDDRGTPPAPPAVPDGAWRPLSDQVQIADITPGAGEPVTPGWVVSVDYAMWTSGGELIDASWSRPDPFPIVLGRRQIIPGWELALSDMVVGGERLARVQSSAAFGVAGAPRIPPDTDLVILMRVLSVSPPRTAPALPETSGASWTDRGDGIRQLDLSTGKGSPATDGLVAVFEWSWWGPDGGLIDSTLTRGQPLRVPLGQHRLRPAAEAAVIGMLPGGRRLLSGPADALAALPPSASLPSDALVTVEIRLTAVEVPR